MKCNFSYAHFRSTLRRFQASEYLFNTFDSLPRRKCKSVLLRHDVDKSVTKALCLAEIEASLGIRANFFIRLHSNYYNPFGHLCYRQLMRIVSLGHLVGLHTEFFDFARIHKLGAKDAFVRELGVFQSIFGVLPTVVAPHRTTGSSLTEVTQKALSDVRRGLSVKSVLDPEFQENWRYISDSSGTWRDGCFCHFVDEADKLHVLVHPDWWYRTAIELEEPVV